jgi:hypothetical protein
MRIEELVLEGFKSYPVRTQITGWDPSFNAITGGMTSDTTCNARLTEYLQRSQWLRKE